MWGSTRVRGLGLRLFPSLADGNVFAEGAELAELEREVDVLLANAHRWGEHQASIEFRLENVREAIRLAKAVEDGAGCVWIS